MWKLLQGVVAVIFLALGFWCSKAGWHLAGFDKVLSCYILFWLGYTDKIYQVSARERSWKAHALLLAVAFGLLCYLNHHGSVEVGLNKYKNPLFFLAASVAGWWMLYEASVFLQKLGCWKRLVVLVGQNTMPILLLHLLSFKLANLMGVLFYGYPIFLIAGYPTLAHFFGGKGWVPVYIAVGVFVPLGLNLGKRNIKKRIGEWLHHE